LACISNGYGIVCIVVAHLSRSTFVSEHICLMSDRCGRICPTCDKCAPNKFLRDKKAHLSHVLRDKKAHLSRVIFYELFVTNFPNAVFFRGSPFYLMSSVIINRFASAFYEILNLKNYTGTINSYISKSRNLID
jgi:hypothetical protein